MYKQIIHRNFCKKKKQSKILRTEEFTPLCVFVKTWCLSLAGCCGVRGIKHTWMSCYRDMINLALVTATLLHHWLFYHKSTTHTVFNSLLIIQTHGRSRRFHAGHYGIADCKNKWENRASTDPSSVTERLFNGIKVISLPSLLHSLVLPAGHAFSLQRQLRVTASVCEVQSDRREVSWGKKQQHEDFAGLKKWEEINQTELQCII